MPLNFRHIMSSYKKPPYGWWLSGGINPANCVAAYQAKGAASYEASKINLANPGTYSLTVNSGKDPSWNTNTGWTSDATKYLKTGVVPKSGWSMIVRFDSTATDAALRKTAGAGETISSKGYGFYLIARRGTTDAHIYGYGNDGTANPAQLITGTRLYGKHSMAIAANNCYLNGSLEGTVSFVEMSDSMTADIYLLTQNYQGTPEVAGFVGAIESAAIYNTTLSAEQIFALHTAMAAL